MARKKKDSLGPLQVLQQHHKQNVVLYFLVDRTRINSPTFNLQTKTRGALSPLTCLNSSEIVEWDPPTPIVAAKSDQSRILAFDNSWDDSILLAIPIASHTNLLRGSHLITHFQQNCFLPRSRSRVFFCSNRNCPKFWLPERNHFCMISVLRFPCMIRRWNEMALRPTHFLRKTASAQMEVTRETYIKQCIKLIERRGNGNIRVGVQRVSRDGEVVTFDLCYGRLLKHYCKCYTNASSPRASDVKTFEVGYLYVVDFGRERWSDATSCRRGGCFSVRPPSSRTIWTLMCLSWIQPTSIRCIATQPKTLRCGTCYILGVSPRFSSCNGRVRCGVDRVRSSHRWKECVGEEGDSTNSESPSSKDDRYKWRRRRGSSRWWTRVFGEHIWTE